MQQREKQEHENIVNNPVETHQTGTEGTLTLMRHFSAVCSEADTAALYHSDWVAVRCYHHSETKNKVNLKRICELLFISKSHSIKLPTSCLLVGLL